MSDKGGSSGKSPTKFMERPRTRPDEEKDLFQDQSGDEGVNPQDGSLNAGQDPANQPKTPDQAVPDKDWYRKWQERLDQRKKKEDLS